MKDKTSVIVIMVLAFCVSASEAKSINVNQLEERQGNEGYQVAQSGEHGIKLQFFYKGKVIYEVNPRHAEKILPKDGLWGDTTSVELIYEHLAPRGSLQQQPKAFDDVTGDGLPDIIILERPLTLINSSVTPSAVRRLSFNGEKVEEGEPYICDIGEMIHFDDYNHDGIFELANTDTEQDFIFTREGLPISDFVLIFDKLLNGYRISAE